MRSVEEQNLTAANKLLDTAMNYARLVLRQYGEIGPFAFSLKADGGVSRETIDRPRLPADPASLWKLLHQHLAGRAHRGQIQAVAAGVNVSLAEPSEEGYADAMVFQIERQGGYAVKVTVPYRIYGGQFRNLFPRRIAQGNVTMEEIPSTIFASAAQPAT